MSTKQKKEIDLEGLSVLLKGYRNRRGLTLKQASNECGVSGSTLSRMERKEATPDSDTLARVARWLEIPVERVVRPGAQTVRSDGADATMGTIEVQLRADPKLPPKAADALIQIMRTAYAQFTAPPSDDED